MQTLGLCLVLLVGLAIAQVNIPCPSLGPSQQCLTVGLTYSATGNYASESAGMIQGLQLWVNTVNSRGGILHGLSNFTYFLSLIAYDDQSSGTVCAQSYRTLIDTNKVNFLFGPFGSHLNAVAIQEANNTFTRNGTGNWDPRVIMLASTSDNVNFSPTNNGFSFGINTLATHYTDSGLWALRDKGLKNVYFIYRSDSTFTVNIYNGAEIVTQLLNLTNVGQQIFNGVPDTATISNIWAAAAAATPTPDSVFILGHRSDAIAFVNGMGSYTFNNIYASSGVTDADFISAVGNSAVGVMSPSQWEVALPYSDPFWGTSQQFVQTFQAANGGAMPNYNSAQTAAAGYLLQWAIQNAAATTQNSIQHFLSTANVTTFYGHVFYVKGSTSGENVDHHCVTIQGVCQAGSMVTPIVSPYWFAQMPFQYPLFKQSCALPSPPPEPVNPPSKPPVSAGGVLLILGFSLMFVYCVAGIGYGKYKGKSGVQLIPNYGFWSAIPGLVKEGCVFTFNKIRCSHSRPSSGVKYDQF